MLDTRPESLSASMRMAPRVKTVAHSYEHDYSSKQVQNFLVEPQDEEEKGLRDLIAAYPGFSLEAIAAADTEADADVNLAAEVLATRHMKFVLVHPSGPREGLNSPTRNTGANRRGIEPREDALLESDDLLQLRYGTGMGICVPQTANQSGKNLCKDTDIENMKTHSLTGASSDGTSRRDGSMGAKESHGVGGKSMSGAGKKKKRRVGVEHEELEPKDAAARRAVEEFLLSMLGEGFHLGLDVVRDVLGYFEGDTQKSMEMLLHMTSTTSKLGSSGDQQGLGLKKSSTIVDADFSITDDSLSSLMAAFPNVDPAQVVMAFQEHNGDLEKVSNALLLDGQVAPKLHSHQEALSKEVDCNHSERRAVHAQLKRLFPVVDDNFLWEVLKSTNFILRNAHQVLLDAGLSPTSERTERSVPSEVVQRKLASSEKSLHKASGKEATTTEPHALQDAWVKVKPFGTPGRKKPTVVNDGASSVGDFGKKKIMVHYQTQGKIGAEDYDNHRQRAKDNWSTMQNYFREAASAYSRGERSYATVLSEKGKYHKHLAQEADERASQRIFADRNKNIENNITIDLHAQHVAEAMQVLKLHLRSLSRILSVHTLTVITGYGSHSSDGRGRIKSAVINFLTRRGIAWKESNAGCIVISLKNARNKILNSADDGISSEYD